MAFSLEKFKEERLKAIAKKKENERLKKEKQKQKDAEARKRLSEKRAAQQKKARAEAEEKLKREKAKERERAKKEKQKAKEAEAEKERVRKEKAKAKLEVKRAARRKLVKKRKNHRYYARKRKKEIDRRNKKGDIKAYHLIVVMKNYKRIQKIGFTWWMTNAYDKFNEAIAKNQEEVKFPVRINETNEKSQKRGVRSTTPLYEIMILQRTPEGQQVNQFRDENGKFVDNVITDNSNYTIIAKHEWLVGDTFNVYGYHPVRDRKDFDFILNEMVLKDVSRDNIKKIMHFSNKLVIQYDSDFDFIICKTAADAERLHDTLRDCVGKNKYIFFTGRLNQKLSAWMLDKMQEKTGWTREACKRIHTL